MLRLSYRQRKVVNMLTEGIQLAALRGEQGGREYYQVMVSNSALNNFFTVNMEPEEDRSQRRLDPKHGSDIAKYLLTNREEYVLGALVYAVDAPCRFEPSTIHDALGVLTIPFGTNLRSIDGQHRRYGLNEAIDSDPTLLNDSTAVLIYVEPDVRRRRQMFSDMNSTTKAVSKTINVAFDSRDPFAIVAQKLVTDHPLLKGRTELEAGRVKPSSDMWFTLSGVHDALKRLFVGVGGRVRNPENFPIKKIAQVGDAFFTALQRNRIELEQAATGLVDMPTLRSTSILFSSTTLRALAGAFHKRFVTDGVEFDFTRYATQLRNLDFSPAAWHESGFVTPGKSTPNARNQEVVAASNQIFELLGSGQRSNRGLLSIDAEWRGEAPSDDDAQEFRRNAERQIRNF